MADPLCNMNYFFLAAAFFVFLSTAGLSGGPHFHSPEFHSLLGGFPVLSRKLFTAGGRDAVRRRWSGHGAVSLPHADDRQDTLV